MSTSPKISRQAVKAVTAIEQSEGVGARVRRSIGSPQLRNLSPFLMLDHFRVPPGAGFADHPHRGMSTVTYMLTGFIEHEDFAGHRGKIGPGDLQWMTAGRGIVHAEIPVPHQDVEPTGLQVWLDLPTAQRMCEPTYQELVAKDIPTVQLSGDGAGVSVKVISGQSHGKESPVRSVGGCWYFDINMKTSGSSVFQAIPEGWTAFAYILSGSVTFGEATKTTEVQTIPEFHTVVISSTEGQTGIKLTAASDNVRFVLLAGEPLTPSIQHGPFVMDTQEEIIQTFNDFRQNKNGFERAKTWQSKIAQSM